MLLEWQTHSESNPLSFPTAICEPLVEPGILLPANYLVRFHYYEDIIALIVASPFLTQRAANHVDNVEHGNSQFIGL